MTMAAAPGAAGNRPAKKKKPVKTETFGVSATPGAVQKTTMQKPPSIWSLDGGVLNLNLHPGQSRVWGSDKRFLLMLAGTQGGKTSFGPWWLYREIMRRGAADYLAVTSSFDLFKLKLLPTLREAFEGVLKIGRYWSGPGVIEICDLDETSPRFGQFYATRSDSPMWGRIILRSAMSKGGLESTTAAAAWLDEAGQDAFNQQTWEAILRRLSLYRGRVLVTTTLYQTGGWLKRLHDQWMNGDPDIDIIQFRSTQNPAFTREEFERAQKSMQGFRFRLFYEGQFGVPPGQIYHLPGEQVVPRFAIPQHWPRYSGHDFGAVNTATVWAAHDEQRDRFYLYRERLAGNMTTKQHCDEILALEAREKEDVICRWGGAPSEHQYRMDWTAANVPVMRPRVADLEGGIDRVTQLINNGQLYVFDDLEGVLKDLKEYRREMDDEGNVFDAIHSKDTFHLGDSVRYLATGITNASVVEAPSIWD